MHCTQPRPTQERRLRALGLFFSFFFSRSASPLAFDWVYLVCLGRGQYVCIVTVLRTYSVHGLHRRAFTGERNVVRKLGLGLLAVL